MKSVAVVVLLWIASNLMGCAPVKYVKTWKNPEAPSINWRGKKVAAFVMTIRKDTREGAEDALARELTRRGAQGMPGYTVIPAEAEQDREKAKRLLSEAGITGAVLMEIVDVKTEYGTTGAQAYYMGPNYSSFWGHWGSGWNALYVPGTVNAKTTLMVQTFIYSVDQDRLVWAGTSKSTNPKDVGTVIMQLVGAAGQEIRKSGLVSR